MTPLEQAVAAIRRWEALYGRLDSRGGTHAEHGADDILPAEQLSTQNADVAAIASHDTAKFHGEGR